MTGSVQISFRADASQVEALERVAAANDRTLSAELRRLVRQHLTQTEAPCGPESIPKPFSVSGEPEEADGSE